MPIYAYRCASCGFEKDHLQKLNAPALTTCPHCGQSSYQKQVTCAGFLLKGQGWYATDFKNGVAPEKASEPKKHDASACKCCAGADACAAS
ncbi:MAG: zinc ribbon domain-containing protein [Candidatus Accumulibacter sp.]|jgi:putative FmdB family regulatory protein|nr:zinc ribbon domain-containing protein [Accumulibacter sp.]